MRRSGILMLLLLAAFVPICAQTATMTTPAAGLNTSNDLQRIILTFTMPSAIDPATFVLEIQDVDITLTFDSSDPELAWSSGQLVFTPVRHFAEGQVIVTLVAAETWAGDPIADLPITSSFVVDFSGPRVIYSGIVGVTDPLPIISGDPLA